MTSKETYSCPFCNSSYSRKFNLERHISNFHSTTTKKETLLVKKQNPFQEVILKLFLHSTFDSSELDENSIHFLTAIYLISSIPKYTFDILWHLLTQLPSTKYYLMFELFTSENIHKAMNQFSTVDTMAMPHEYKSGLLSISSFILKNNMTRYTKYTDMVSIISASDKLVVSLE